MNDLISRQAAIDLINDIDLINFTAKGVIRSGLRKLPSAQQEPKTAHWVPLDERFASWSDYFKCSECGFRIKLRAVTDFGGQSVECCPHCMARMEVKKMDNQKIEKWEDVPHKSVEHGSVVIGARTVRCPVCRHAYKAWNASMDSCPNCGAKMEVEHEA